MACQAGSHRGQTCGRNEVTHPHPRHQVLLTIWSSLELSFSRLLTPNLRVGEKDLSQSTGGKHKALGWNPALHLVLSARHLVPTQAAVPSSRLTVKEQLHLYSPEITFSPLKATMRLMWPLVKVSLTPLSQRKIKNSANASTRTQQTHRHSQQPCFPAPRTTHLAVRGPSCMSGHLRSFGLVPLKKRLGCTFTFGMIFC